MNKREIITVLVSVCSLLLAPCALAQQELKEQVPQKPEASAPLAITLSTSKPTLQGTLLPTSTLIGTPVKNPQGEELGKIQELMIDPQTGRIVSAVLSFGGTLGMGEKRLTIPWETLTVGISKSELVVATEKEQLQPAPGGETTQPPAPADHE